MEHLILEDMIKALKCIASYDAEGDCYADCENFIHMEDDNYKRFVCASGEDLKDCFSEKSVIGCPYHQNKYGLCFEDGELSWLKDAADLLEELKSYKEAEEQGILVRLPCKPGDTVYTLSYRLTCIHNYDCKVYQKWKCEDNIPCEYENKVYYVKEAKFCFPMLQHIGEKVFLTREEAEKKLEEL